MTIIGLLISVLIFAIVLWVLWYIIQLLPPPIQRPATVVLIVLAAIVLILFLLQFAGVSLPTLGRPIR